MKKIQLATIGMMLLSTAFTACKKDNTYEMTPATSMEAANQARVIESNSKVIFTAGYLNASAMSMRANGEMLYESHDMHNWDMFNPIRKAGITIAPNTYRLMTTTVQASPHNATSSAYLLGLLTSNDAAGNEHPGIPVTFLINNSIQLTASSESMAISESTNIINLLNLNLEKLTANITADMWKNAEDYLKGTITISETQNPELYKIILQNMNTMLQVSVVNTTQQPTIDYSANRPVPAPVVK